MPETIATMHSRHDTAPAAGHAPARDGRIPIVVGITGHRALRAADEPAITAQVTSLFARLRRDCPHSPIVLLTALAEGADRLVAHAALAAGARLLAVLPLEPADYEMDFATTASRDAFRALLSDPRTDRIVVIPCLDPAARRDGDARNMQYLFDGLFIARHSDVLIALWDGSAARGTGGTQQIVTFKQTGRLDVDSHTVAALTEAPAPFEVIDAPLDAAPTGLVYHVPAARADDAVAPSDSAAWLVPPRHAGTPAARDAFVEQNLTTLRRRDELNREGATLRDRHRSRLDAGRAMLTRGEPVVPAALDGLRESFALADVLAVAHQKSTYRMLIALFVLVGVATISLVFRNLAISDDARRVYLGGYLLLLAVADLAYLRTRGRRSQDRFQDYRALAEGLRVQFFWRLAGLPHAASDYYLRKQRSELRWIRDALNVCALCSAPPVGADIEAVQRLWVEDQHHYYRRASARDGYRGRRQRAVGSALVLLSLSATMVWLWSIAQGAAVFIAIALLAALVLSTHCAYEIVHALRDSTAGDRRVLREMLGIGALSVGIALALWAAAAYGGPQLAGRAPLLSLNASPFEWMLAAIGITALVGTFAHGFANVRAFGEHQKQYERMEELFHVASTALSRATPSETATRHGAERVLLDLGREALAEHADWLLLHRARPMELPTAEL
jgi:CheY-like chemotaxis protein